MPPKTPRKKPRTIQDFFDDDMTTIQRPPNIAYKVSTRKNRMASTITMPFSSRSRTMIALLISIIELLCTFSFAFQGVYTTARTTSYNIQSLHAQSQDYLESTTYGIDAPYKEAHYDPVSDQFVGEKLLF